MAGIVKCHCCRCLERGSLIHFIFSAVSDINHRHNLGYGLTKPLAIIHLSSFEFNTLPRSINLTKSNDASDQRLCIIVEAYELTIKAYSKYIFILGTWLHFHIDTGDSVANVWYMDICAGSIA